MKRKGFFVLFCLFVLPCFTLGFCCFFFLYESEYTVTAYYKDSFLTNTFVCYRLCDLNGMSHFTDYKCVYLFLCLFINTDMNAQRTRATLY